MSVIRWEDPPPSVRLATVDGRHGESHHTARQLKAKPGMWGVVLETSVTSTAGTAVARIRTGRYGYAPAGAFEAVMRTRARGAQYTVYARYVGEASDAG